MWVRLGLGLMGKPGHAWVGAWVLHGWCGDDVVGGNKFTSQRVNLE